MQNTITQYLGNVSTSRDKELLQTLFAYVARQANTVAVRGAGLEIAAGGSALMDVPFNADPQVIALAFAASASAAGPSAASATTSTSPLPVNARTRPSRKSG